MLHLLVLGHGSSFGKEIKLSPSFIQYTRLNSKWIQGKNVNNKTMKVLKEHMGEFLYNPGVGKAFLIAAYNPETKKENIHKN